MRQVLLALATVAVAAPAIAEESREMGAHVHGVSKAEIAMEHGRVEIDLLSPGVDIVGFEHEATTAADKDAVQAAILKLLSPADVLTLPAAAGCRLTEAMAHLHGGGDHDHDDHAHGDDGHDDDDHHEHEEDEDHAEGSAHSEFHATYAFSCDDEDALTTVRFGFFDLFENAREISVQYVGETGAGTARLTSGAPELTFE